jgi:hypothetical protein
MAGALELTVGNHLQDLNSRSPHTNFYAKAARGIEVESNDQHAIVRIPKLGFALRYHGGTVTPGKSISSHTGLPTRALAIPSDDVPYVGDSEEVHRQKPGEYPGLLAFIPARAGGRTVGYLLDGEEKTITRGKNKGKTRIVPKAGGSLLYTLASEIIHQPDESVLPSEGVLLASASEAAGYYLDSR